MLENGVILFHFSRKRILNRKCYSALLLMSTLPEFHKSLLKFLHKTMVKESLKAARSISQRSEALSRDSLKTFSITKEYEILVRESPILMTVLYGAASKQKIDAIQVIQIS